MLNRSSGILSHSGTGFSNAVVLCGVDGGGDSDDADDDDDAGDFDYDAHAGDFDYDGYAGDGAVLMMVRMKNMMIMRIMMTQIVSVVCLTVSFSLQSRTLT